MSHKRTVALVAAGSLLGGLVMMISGAFAQGNTAGTLALQPGNNMGVSCPNSLSNAAKTSKAETVQCAANPATTTTVPVTTTTVPVTTTTVPASGGTCTNPTYSTSDASGTEVMDPSDGEYWWVNNDAWSGTAGPQTMNVCSQSSWYAVSDQTNQGGAVETYPDTEYDIGGRANGLPTKTIAQYSQITSTFSEDFPTDGTIDAAYDLWLNNYSTEIMIWNEDSGTNDYWNTQGTPVTIGGVDYQFANSGGPLVFIMKNQEKAGSVDILAVLNYLAANGYVKSTDVPTQLEYGVEICSTVGSESFPLTGLTFNLS